MLAAAGALRRTRRKRSGKAPGQSAPPPAAGAPVGEAEAADDAVAPPAAPNSEAMTFSPAPGDGVAPSVPAQPIEDGPAPEDF